MFSDPDEAFGDTVTISVSGLPSGVEYDETTLTISGTPTSPGSTTVQITAEDVEGLTTSITFSLEVFGVPLAGDPVRIQAEDLEIGFGFFVENQAAADEGQVIRLGTNASGTAELTIAPPLGITAGANDLTVAFFDENDGDSSFVVQLTKADALPGDPPLELGTIVLNQDGGGNAAQPQNFRTVTLPGVDIQEGDVLTIFGNSIGTEFARLDYVEFTPLGGQSGNFRPFPIPGFDTDISGFEGELSITLAAAFGDPEDDALTFALGPDAPEFLSIDPVTGELIATEAIIGEYTVEVLATDEGGSNQTASQTFTLTVEVNPEVPPALVTPIEDQLAVEDVEFTLDVSTTFETTNDDPITLAAGVPDALPEDPLLPLPAWLTFDPSTGTFTGTPTQADLDALEAAGPLTIVVRATDNDGDTDATFALSIDPVNGAPTLDPLFAGFEAATATSGDTEPLVIPLAGVFIDEEGDPITFSLVNTDDPTAALPEWITLDATTDPANPVILVAPPEDAVTVETLINIGVVASDEEPLSSDPAPLALTVQPSGPATDGLATLSVNTGGTSLFGDSTFGANSIQIVNQSANDVAIDQIIID